MKTTPAGRAAPAAQQHQSQSRALSSLFSRGAPYTPLPTQDWVTKARPGICGGKYRRRRRSNTAVRYHKKTRLRKSGYMPVFGANFSATKDNVPVYVNQRDPQFQSLPPTSHPVFPPCLVLLTLTLKKLRKLPVRRECFNTSEPV